MNDKLTPAIQLGDLTSRYPTARRPTLAANVVSTSQPLAAQAGLQMLAAGCSYQQASERLGISLHTVSSHVKSAYRKLDVHSAGAAVMRAVALRIISVHEEGTQNHGVAAATPAA